MSTEQSKLVLALFSGGSEKNGKTSRDDLVRIMNRYLIRDGNRTRVSDWKDIVDEIAQERGMAADELDAVVETASKELESAGVKITTIVDRTYPVQLRTVLRDRAPVFLFFRGNPELFQELSIGFCGSRHASERGLGVCEDIVEQLVNRGTTITAGYAAGVDQISHACALRLGGRTVAVLSEGILHFSIKRVFKGVWDWSRALVISEYLPNARWTVGRAMQRNRTIIGMSRALVVIEAKETGGTFAAGQAALSLRHPVFAPIYVDEHDSSEGNRILIEQGALPVMKSRETGRAKLGALFSKLDGTFSKEA